MRTPKHILFENLLTNEECNLINERYVSCIKNGWKGYTYDQIEWEAKAISLDRPYQALNINCNQIIDRIKDRLENEYHHKFEFHHSFIRYHINKCSLHIHTDMQELDMTVSVNVGGLDTWPIFISNTFCEKEERKLLNLKEELKFKYKQDYSKFITPRGSGVACYGSEFPHWRDELICEDHEYVLQIFFHWKILAT